MQIPEGIDALPDGAEEGDEERLGVPRQELRWCTVRGLWWQLACMHTRNPVFSIAQKGVNCRGMKAR